MNEAIRLQDVSKIYRQGDIEVHAVDHVSLSIRRGGFVSICGPSGSGKTTLLNLIGCLDEVSSGEIWIDGKTVSSLKDRQKADLRLNKIGFIFQSYNLIPVLSAVENVAFVLQLRGIGKLEREQKSIAVLEEVGLKGLEDRRPSQLSGGQQQRVAIARAIVSEPEFILADEPTANVDSKTSIDLLDLMKRLNASRKVTFIFSTHDPLVMDYADRIVHLLDGRIVDDQLRAS